MTLSPIGLLGRSWMGNTKRTRKSNKNVEMSKTPRQATLGDDVRAGEAVHFVLFAQSMIGSVTSTSYNP